MQRLLILDRYQDAALTAAILLKSVGFEVYQDLKKLTRDTVVLIDTYYYAYLARKLHKFGFNVIAFTTYPHPDLPTILKTAKIENIIDSIKKITKARRPPPPKLKPLSKTIEFSK